jgi:hypothetical protein
MGCVVIIDWSESQVALAEVAGDSIGAVERFTGPEFELRHAVHDFITARSPSAVLVSGGYRDSRAWLKSVHGTVCSFTGPLELGRRHFSARPRPQQSRLTT